MVGKIMVAGRLRNARDEKEGDEEENDNGKQYGQAGAASKHLGFGSGGLFAFRAGADGAEMVVGIDAGGVAVGERDLDGVVAHLRGRGGAGFGFEHWQGWR